MSAGRTDELTRVLGELEHLERELVEHGYVRRSDGSERVSEALARLGEVGSPAGIIARSAPELGSVLDLDGVLISRIEGEQLQPLALWARAGEDHAARGLTELESRSIPLRYPLIEAEVAQRHEPAIASFGAGGRRAIPELQELLGWNSYAVADLVLEGNVAGFLHAGRLGGEAVDEIDLELVSRCSEGLAQVFERAVLREQLQRQRAQLQAAGQWVTGQIRAISADQAAAASAAIGDGELSGLLTARELDVMRLLAQGHSNRDIAAALVLGEGTVKYHVKNILRKLHARSRTVAISRYMKLQGGVEP